MRLEVAVVKGDSTLTSRLAVVVFVVAVTSILTAASVLLVGFRHHSGSQEVSKPIDAAPRDNGKGEAIAPGIYLTISGGLMVSNDEYQALWEKYVGTSEPPKEGSPQPLGGDQVDAAIAALQVQRATELARLATQAGFNTATPVRYPGPPYECIETDQTTQCADTTPAGAFMMVVASPPLEGAPPVLEKVEVRQNEYAVQRVLPYSTLLEFDTFRRAALDDPVIQDKLARLRDLITSEAATNLAVKANDVRLNVSILPR